MDIVINIYSNTSNEKQEQGQSLIKSIIAAAIEAVPENSHEVGTQEIALDSAIKYAASAQSFKFELSQLVDINTSEEFGEVRARAQHSDGGNQYLIHYKSATGCANTLWFDEEMLTATESDEYPGCPVFAGVDLPKGIVKLNECDEHNQGRS